MYSAARALYKAHHLRELERAYEQDRQQWAARMTALLTEIHTAVLTAGGRCLDATAADICRDRYPKLLAEAECPAPAEKRKNGSRGRPARSKSRNLLERLRDCEDEVLRFMIDLAVPFSSNQAENDLRMTKVQ